VPTSNLNPANAVTALRALTFFPIWYFVARGERQYAFVVLCVGGTMDLLDGWVAKTFHCQTTFGEVFDAVVDGILYGSVLIVVTYYGWAPLWPVVLILGLGVVNLAGRFVYARRAGRTTNFQSFAMEQFVGNTAFLIGFAVVDFEVQYYFWVCSMVMVAIVIHDTKRMIFDPVPQ